MQPAGSHPRAFLAPLTNWLALTVQGVELGADVREALGEHPDVVADGFKQ
jgi:hypothetical protein